MLKRILLLTFAALVCSTVAAGGPDIEQLKADAAAGDVGAQIELSDFYLRGEKVGQDMETGAELLKKAANKGSSLAQYRLGTLYRRGWGVPADDKQAFRWYLKSAQQDNAAACYAVGTAYREGVGVREDSRRAIYWYEKAVDQEVTIARIMLASLYLEASGSGRNYKRLVELLQPLAQNGYIYALAQLGKLYEEGWGVKKNYGLAANSYHKALALETPPEGDSVESKQLFQMTTTARLEAANRLGMLYLKGLGVDMDHARAAGLFGLAAQQGLTEAEVNLARLYQLGQGVEQNTDKAVAIFTQAASRGDPVAHHELGLYYLNWDEKPRDITRAYVHLSLAKSLGASVKPEHTGRVTRMLAPNQRMVLKKHIEKLLAQMQE